MKKNLIGSEELEQFYKDKFYFSYSSINKLLFSPSMFYTHYVLRQKEDSVDPHLVKGRVIHCLLLNEKDFDKEFIIVPGKLPSGNNRLIVDEIFKIHLNIGNDSLLLENHEVAIINLLEKINLHQKLKTDEARTKKILVDDNINYFDFLKKSQGKTLVDYETLAYCKECVESVKKNDNIRTLLQLDKTKEDTHIEVYNELPITTENNLYFNSELYGFKGILDNLIIDKEAKRIFINDVKTTGKPLMDFPDSVEYYKYWIQAAIYYQLAFYKFLKGNEEDIDKWTITFTFVVIDKYNQVYPFQVSGDTMLDWLVSLRDEIIPVLEYHYNKKDYTLPYELALGNIKL